MTVEQIVVSLVVIVVVNVVVVSLDVRFWKRFFTDRSKRHKKVKTSR